MPNWCFNNMTVTGPKEEISSVWENLEEATRENPLKADFGNMWLGNLLLYLGYPEEEVRSGPIRCRGSISYMERESDEMILIDTETAWAPMMQVFLLFLEKYGPSCKLLYTSEEPGCGLFLTNDPDPGEEYLLDAWEWPEDAPECLKENEHSYMSKGGLKELLEEALGHEGTLGDLIREADGKWGEYMNIHRFEYYPVEELN